MGGIAMAITNVSEFQDGQKVFRVTTNRLNETPVSQMLCGNFIEVGFGYQVEAMFSEMFYNRSFEKACHTESGRGMTFFPF